MGLLDALFSNDSGGGLLGGLPSSWQYQNPANKDTSTQDFINALTNQPYAGIGGGTAPPTSPFGPVPQFSQQPPSVFAGGAAPVTQGFDPSMLPQQQPPAAPMAPPQAPPVAPAAMPTPQNNPVNTMNVGGYQMPQFGSVADYTPQSQPAQPSSTDISAQSQTASPQSLPPALQDRSFLTRIGNPDGLIARLTGNDPRSLAQQNLRATFDATRQVLRQSGMSEQEASSKAMLATLNPEAAKTILPEALTNKEQYKKTGVDALGNETYGFVNERDQTINGKALGAEGGGAQSVGGFLAPGVKSIDSSLTGVDYLKQFSPEVQAAVQNYVDGKSMPTGNPRKGFTQTVKMIAQKYGADTGEPVDDVKYAERRTMRNQLAQSSNSSMGGILSNGESSFKHLAEYAKSAADQGNVSHNFPLGGVIAHAQNYVANAGGGSDTQGKVKAINDNLGKYGAESTKFYAGTGGGVEERLNALKEMNGNSTSGEEAAAYAEKEKNLMLDRLNTKLQEIRNTLGDAEGSRIIAKHMPDIQKNIEAIDANVARLRDASSSAPSGLPSGWSVKVR